MTQSTTPPIPTSYTPRKHWQTQEDYMHIARAEMQRRLQAAGVDYGSPYLTHGTGTRDVLHGTLHMPLFVASELLLSPGAAPAPLSLPLHSGAGHTTYWTRAEQRELAVLMLGIYHEIAQALDDLRERVEANVAVMLDASNDQATREAAWALVRALETPADDDAKTANLRASIDRVRGRTDPPDTDLTVFAGVHADRLRALGARRLRWLLGDPPRDTSSQETAAADRIARTVREYALRIARAADAATVRIEHAAGVRILEAIAIGAAPRWRLVRTGQPDIDLPGLGPITLPAVTRAQPLPLRAAVIEAWSAPAEPSELDTAQPTLVETAVAADPAKLRAAIVRGASIGVDRLVLDWLTETPGGPVTVTATARNVTGASERRFVVPAPTAPAAG